jgi:flagellar L-ring protein precursor FlgH
MRCWQKIVIVMFLGSMLSVVTPSPIVNAASLWSDTGRTTSLFSDHKAQRVGDTLTIIINENSSANRTGRAANSKSSNTKLDAGVGIFHWLAMASAANADDFKAQGSLSNTNTMNAKLTVTVTDVSPNGNLIVSGSQSIKQNGEEQKITVTGTVRPEDISADNSVLSTYVADAQLRLDGHGPIARKQRQGVFSQIFNFLF